MGRTRSEAVYQADVVKRIEALLPDCFIIRLDPDEFQGIPDLLILFENKWAMLEVKATATAPQQPNQEYYVDMFNDMSYATFIHPSNEEEVLEELITRFGS